MSMEIPKPRAHVRRIEPEWAKLQPSDTLLVHERQARPIRQYMVRRGWKCVQRMEGGKVRVWRTE